MRRTDSRARARGQVCRNSEPRTTSRKTHGNNNLCWFTVSQHEPNSEPDVNLGWFAVSSGSQLVRSFQNQYKNIYSKSLCCGSEFLGICSRVRGRARHSKTNGWMKYHVRGFAGFAGAESEHLDMGGSSHECTRGGFCGNGPRWLASSPPSCRANRS
jgi:hypothetical protein